jgi:hypothetical protein
MLKKDYLACKRMRKMCWDKIKYESELDAESYGKLYNYRHKENKPYRAYFCEICLKWHLTTKPKHVRVFEN